MASELVQLLPTAKIDLVDFMSRQTSVINWLMKQIYLKMLAVIPNIYDVCYKMSSEATGGSLVQQAFAMVMKPVLAKLLQHYQPDLVVCTHPFPAGAMSRWKEQTGSKLPLAVVMTDYSLHQIWLYDKVDQYFMATENMRQEMVKRGFAANLLQVTGIPVNIKIDLAKTKILRQVYNLPANTPVVLIMGGGLGLGDISKTLQELENLSVKLAILVVAGHNEKLQADVKSFAKGSRHVVKSWGYTEKIHELMQLADLLITKPGGLTISEAFVVGVPMLLHDPIPGPETENAVYATRNGAAIWLHPGEKLAPAVKELIGSSKLEAMREQAQKCAKPYAARQIAQALADKLVIQ